MTPEQQVFMRKLVSVLDNAHMKALSKQIRANFPEVFINVRFLEKGEQQQA